MSKEDVYRTRLLHLIEQKYPDMGTATVSVELGLGQNTLAGYLDGSHLPHLATAIKIAKKLGVTVGWMLGER